MRDTPGLHYSVPLFSVFLPNTMFMQLRTILYAGLLCLPALVQPAKAQWHIGLEAGWNKNHLQTSVSNRPFTKYEPLQGFSVAIPVLYQFNNWLAVHAAPGIITKNYQLTRTGVFEGIFQKHLSQYLQVPVAARFSFGGTKLKGFLNLGGYAAYWMNSRLKGFAPNYFDITLPNENEEVDRYLDVYPGVHFNQKYEWNSRRDRRMELGVVAGAGISYSCGIRNSFFVEARYYRGLTDLQKNYMINQVPRFNDTYTLQAGYLYQLKQKAKR